MCYAKPRPRCSGHAKQALAKAQTAHAFNPTTATAAALREAERDFAITPDGIKQVRTAASKAIDKREYKRSALLSQDADNRESLRELLSESVKGVREPSPNDYIPYVVAAHPAPAFAYDYFAKSDDEAVRRVVAADPSAPTLVLSRLAKDRNDEVCSNAAQNSSTPAAVLTRLAKTRYYGIRGSVAGNPSTPAETLRYLAYDVEVGVKLRVARNPSTPAEVLSRLATTKDYPIQIAVAENPSIPAEALWMLTNDDNADVRTEARSRILTSPTVVAARLGMSDDIPAVETILRDHPSQVKSMFGWA